MNVTIQQKALRLSVLGVLMVSIAFALSACNTVEGAGKDIESAGESISDAAD
ncbi:MAG: entericidin A/B family lipoprotein [Planctomycetes bacterium]|nr:entericidin A/B family lipoprotein [Planctomycetota bacterium]